jgi:hypothetical protein
MLYSVTKAGGLRTATAHSSESYCPAMLDFVVPFEPRFAVMYTLK